MQEWIRKSRYSLDWWECPLSNIVWLRKSENTSHLIKSDTLLDFEDIFIQLLNVLNIAEDKGALWVKAKCNNIFDVADSHSNCVFKFGFFSIHEFFIICNLDD